MSNDQTKLEKNAKKKPKRGRQNSTLSIREKLEAVNKIKQGAKITKVANELRTHPSTVRLWMRNENMIAALDNQVLIPAKRFRNRQPENNCVDEATWIWFQGRRDAGLPINGSIIRAQALEFHKVLGGTKKFVASDGWLAKWKARHSINDYAIPGTKLSIDLPAADEFKVSFQKLRQEENLSFDQIFACDEIGVNFKMLPQRPLSEKEKKEFLGMKGKKERLTVLACCNASASLKLPLMVIGKSEKSKAIKDWSNCPVYYKSQQSGWLDSHLFKIWFHQIFVPTTTSFLEDKKLPVKAVLLVENCSAHPRLQDGDIRVEFFPKKTALVIQPLDQGILTCLMINYRKNLMVNLLYKLSNDNNNLKDSLKSIKLKDVIIWLSQAWKEVPASTIVKSWNQVWSRNISHIADHEYIRESLPCENLETMDNENDERNEKRFKELTKRFHQYLLGENEYNNLQPSDIDEWLYNPKKKDVHTLPSDQHIIDLISGASKNDEVSSDEESDEEVVPLNVAKQCIDKVILYCERNGKCYSKEDLETFYRIKNSMIMTTLDKDFNITV